MKHIEDDHQMALIKWADLANVNGICPGHFIFHPANGGKRNAREASRLKKMGVRPGVSDIIMLYPSGGFHGLLIELKSPATQKSKRGTLRDSQVKWQSRMGDVGYFVVTCWGWESAKKTIEEYLLASKRKFYVKSSG